MNCPIAVKADQLTVSRFYLELLSRVPQGDTECRDRPRYYNHLVREKIRRVDSIRKSLWFAGLFLS
jgi:hypothetical protein